MEGTVSELKLPVQQKQGINVYNDVWVNLSCSIFTIFQLFLLDVNFLLKAKPQIAGASLFS
jgi:hypothetical protein